MDPANTQPHPAKSLQARMRSIHRVLGYLAVGMMIVYSLSGITMLYRTTGFLKHSTPVEQTLEPGLDAAALGQALKLKALKPTAETEQTIEWADGLYDRTTGQVAYARKDFVWPLNRFIDLHKISEAKSGVIAWSATVFGAILFLLAVTSLFMFKPKGRMFKANMVWTAIGIAATVVLLVFA